MVLFLFLGSCLCVFTSLNLKMCMECVLDCVSLRDVAQRGQILMQVACGLCVEKLVCELGVYVSECLGLRVCLCICGSSLHSFGTSRVSAATTASSMGHHNHMRPAFPRGGAMERINSKEGI